MFTPTTEQLAFFDGLRHSDGSALLSACAGSGKTTTIVEGLKVLPVRDPETFMPPATLFLAFNKSIADTLRARCPRHVTCATFHSYGYRALRDSGLIPESTLRRKDFIDSRKVPKLVWSQMDREDPDVQSVIKLVSLLKSVVPGSVSAEALASHYDLDFAEPKAAFHVAQLVLDRSSKTLNTIDFDDMLYLPILLGLRFAPQAYVFVDEAQDTNDIQLEILSRSSPSRLVAVGDPFQAIYGFRGANSDAMQRIATRFSCTSLQLSVSFRCPKRVVAEAQRALALNLSE